MRIVGENIVFIIGSPRSGTTWLQKILGSHEKIVTAQESDIFTSIIDPILKNYFDQLNSPSGRGGTGLPCYFTKEEIIGEMRNIFYTMLNKTEWSEDKYFVEKTPSHALTIDTIKVILPKAKIIHIVRDPRDVASSMISASKSWGRNWAPSNIFTAAKMWKQHITAAEKSFEKIDSNYKYILKYEDLKEDPISALQGIFMFINIPLNSKNIGTLLNEADSTILKKYGEFGKRSGEIVNDPKDFIRKKVKNDGWKSDIGILKGFIISMILNNEMKRYCYK